MIQLILKSSFSHMLYEPRHEKTYFSHICESKGAVTAQLISTFVFATKVVQSLNFLNLAFQASFKAISYGMVQPSLYQTWSATTKTGVLDSQLIWILISTGNIRVSTQENLLNLP